LLQTAGRSRDAAAAAMAYKLLVQEWILLVLFLFVLRQIHRLLEEVDTPSSHQGVTFFVFHSYVHWSSYF